MGLRIHTLVTWCRLSEMLPPKQEKDLPQVCQECRYSILAFSTIELFSCAISYNGHHQREGGLVAAAKPVECGDGYGGPDRTQRRCLVVAMEMGARVWGREWLGVLSLPLAGGPEVAKGGRVHYPAQCKLGPNLM
jgi:hypothetical protein